MADQPQEQANSEQGKKKRAHGAFPRLSLSKILELPAKIYELGEGEEVRRLSVFDKLGKSPTSGPSRELIGTANSGYGLITGGHSADYLGLTDRGREIVAGEDKVRKHEAIYDALFSNEIFSAFVIRFKDRGVPADEVAIDYLTQVAT